MGGVGGRGGRGGRGDALRAPPPAGSCSELDLTLLCLMSGNDYTGALAGYELAAAFDALARSRRDAATDEPLVCVAVDGRCSAVNAGVGSVGLVGVGSKGEESEGAASELPPRDLSLNLPYLGALLLGCAHPRPHSDDVAVEGAAFEARCHTYLRTLLWVLQTYADGACPDFGWEVPTDFESPSAYALGRWLINNSNAVGSDANAVGASVRDANAGVANADDACNGVGSASEGAAHGFLSWDLCCPRSSQPPLPPLMCPLALLPASAHSLAFASVQRLATTVPALLPHFAPRPRATLAGALSLDGQIRIAQADLDAHMATHRPRLSLSELVETLRTAAASLPTESLQPPERAYVAFQEASRFEGDHVAARSKAAAAAAAALARITSRVVRAEDPTAAACSVSTGARPASSKVAAKGAKKRSRWEA